MADEAAHKWAKHVTESEDGSAELTWSLFIDAAEAFPQAHHKLLELLDVTAQLPMTEKEVARNFEEYLPRFVCELHDTFLVRATALYFQLLENDILYCRYRECLTK